jgi:hypothetical protein
MPRAQSVWTQSCSVDPDPQYRTAYQNRQFKPKLITVTLVSYEPIKTPADGLAE